MIGLGIGIILGATLMSISGIQYELKREQIEMKAKSYGMHYSDECKVIFDKEVK